MRTTNPLAGFMTPEAFAKSVGVPVPQVRRWIRHGELPAVKIGRLLMIPKDALRIALEDSRKGVARQ